jgi:hypothetical protein
VEVVAAVEGDIGDLGQGHDLGRMGEVRPRDPVRDVVGAVGGVRTGVRDEQRPVPDREPEVGAPAARPTPTTAEPLADHEPVARDIRHRPRARPDVAQRRAEHQPRADAPLVAADREVVEPVPVEVADRHRGAEPLVHPRIAQQRVRRPIGRVAIAASGRVRRGQRIARHG